LDILRKHRPDYTPRTGFTWPISEPSTVTDGKIQKTRESEASGQSQTVDHHEENGGPVEGSSSSLPLSHDSSNKRGAAAAGAAPDSSSSSNSRKQQNTMLLMNAMKTTAAHSSKMNLMSFTQQTASSQIQNLHSPKEVVVEQHQHQQHQSDSGTPFATISTIRSSPTPETIQEGAKGPAAGGKKKKKRASLAPPPPQVSP